MGGDVSPLFKGNNSTSAAKGLRIQSSVYGQPLPIVYGANRIAGNLIWYGDFKAIAQTQEVETGKGGGGTETIQTGWKYRASFMIGLCEGQINEISKFWEGTEQKQMSVDIKIGKIRYSSSVFTVFDGSQIQDAWSYLETKHPSKALKYRNLAYVATANYELGATNLLPNFTFETYGIGCGDITGELDVDAKSIIYDYLTNSRYGTGFPVGKIGDWSEYETYCKAAGLLFSPVYDAQTQAQGKINDLISLTNSGVYFSEGVLKIKPFGDKEITGNGVTFTPDLTVVASLDDDDFIVDDGDDPVRIIRSAQADAYNCVKIRCLDRNNEYNETTIEEKDQVNIEQHGLRIMPVIDASEICKPEIASRIAQLILQDVLYIRNQYEFRVGIKYCYLEPTDLLSITDAEQGLDQHVVRILSIEEEDDGFQIIAEDAHLGVRSQENHDTQLPDGYSHDFDVDPGDTLPPLIFIPPSEITTSGLELWFAANGGGDWGGCEIWASYDGTSYEYMGTINVPARKGSLTAALPIGSDPDTVNTLSIDLDNGALNSVPQSDADNYGTLSYVGGELVSYRTATLTAPGKYDLTYLRRGVYGTTIQAHSIGDTFCRLDGAVFKKSFPADKIGKTIYFKFPAYNQYGSNIQQLSDISAVQFTIDLAQIPAVQDISVDGTYGAIQIGFTRPESEDFGGVNVYLSSQQGFTPSADLIVYSGPDNQITINAQANGDPLQGDTTYYIIIAAYSKYSQAYLTYSSEYSVSTIAPIKTARTSLYQWSTVEPAAPTGTSQFTWSSLSNGSYNGGDGWTVTIPANPGTPGIKLWQAELNIQAYSTDPTTTIDWATAGPTISAVSVNGAQGNSGVQTADPKVYKWALTIPSGPTGTSQFTWSSGNIDPVPTGWSLTPPAPPAVGFTLWVASVHLIETPSGTDPVTESTINWTLATIAATGYSGNNGGNARICYAKSTTDLAATPETITTTGDDSFPPNGSWGTGTVWQATPPVLSTGEKLWVCDGMYDPTADETTWNVPYQSSFKVGSLSAISANLGTVNAGVLKSTSWDQAQSSGTFFDLDNGTFKLKKDGVDRVEWDNNVIAIQSDVFVITSPGATDFTFQVEDGKVKINGILVVDGSIDTPQITENAVTNVGYVGSTATVDPYNMTPLTLNFDYGGGQLVVIYTGAFATKTASYYQAPTLGCEVDSVHQDSCNCFLFANTAVGKDTLTRMLLLSGVSTGTRTFGLTAALVGGASGRVDLSGRGMLVMELKK